MADLDEIEVISKGGIPLYFHSNSGKTQDDTYMLQASFLTALNQFATELNNGDVKLIAMDRKEYLLSKTDNFTVIFTTYHPGTNFAQDYEEQIQQVKGYISDQLSTLNVDINNPNSYKVEETMDNLDYYLRQQKLVEGEQYNASSFGKRVNNLVFRSVGYEPGKCNIGRAERMQRLTFGLVFFTISLLGFAAIVLLGLPEWLTFLLVVPNFLGFLGVLQYGYRFCTTNALSHQYQMV